MQIKQASFGTSSGSFILLLDRPAAAPSTTGARVMLFHQHAAFQGRDVMAPIKVKLISGAMLSMVLGLAFTAAQAAVINCKGGTCDGTSSSDTITGTAVRDVIHGLAGADFIRGLASMTAAEAV